MAEHGEANPSVEGDLAIHPGRPRPRDELDPELQLILALRQAKGISGLCDLPPAEQREQMRRDPRPKRLE